MGYLILFIITGIIVYKNKKNERCRFENSGDYSLNARKQFYDDLEVTLGRLSEEEFKKRKRSGHYLEKIDKKNK